MSHIIRSFFIFLFFMIVCFIFRLAFLLLHIDFSFSDMFSSIFSGLRLDSQFCAAFASFYCVFGFLHKKIAKGIFIFLSLLLIIPELIFFAFFNIYRQKINMDLFLFTDEKFTALINTALKENYGILPIIISFFIIFFIFMLFYKYIEKINITCAKRYVLAGFSVFTFLMLITINQQISFKASKKFMASIPEFDNHVLKTSTLGHLNNFYRIVGNYFKYKKVDFKDFNVGTPKEAACEFFNINPCDGNINLYEYFNHAKTTDLNIQPKKVYYIISESLSNWSMDKKFYEVFFKLHDFVNSKATYITAIQNGSNTRSSINSQFLGAFIEELNVVDLYSSILNNSFYPSNVFNDLGYTVSFYYGGARNWAGTEDLGSKVGINNFYGESESTKWASMNNYQKPYSNLWGVFDDILFDYIKDTSKEKTINIIMTTTNHQPYDLNFLEHSNIKIPFDKIEKLSKEYKNELATIYWYQKILVDWIEKTAQKEPNSLFVITGDHYGRFNIDNSNDLFLTHSIPVIFYYPSAKIYPTCKITNHLDIAASIINLIAPKGYEYVSFGSPCFSLEEQKIKDETKIGYGIIYENKEFKSETRKNQLAKALSWYLIFKGNIIE